MIVHTNIHHVSAGNCGSQLVVLQLYKRKELMSNLYSRWKIVRQCSVQSPIMKKKKEKGDIKILFTKKCALLLNT